MVAIQSYNVFDDPIFLEDNLGHWCYNLTNAKVFESKEAAQNFINNNPHFHYIADAGYEFITV